jgi:hypothetical protein
MTSIRVLTATDDYVPTYPRVITAEVEPDYPEYVVLFLNYVDFDPRNINWVKVTEFNNEFAQELTQDQKLFLHNLQFKTKI